MKEEKLVSDKQNSCKISINKNGEYSCEVKVYHENVEGAVKFAIEKAAELEKLVKEKNK